MWGRTAVLAAVLASAGTSSVSASDVDWRSYGAAKIETPSVCFYDNAGIKRRDHFVQVWTKCVLVSALDSVDIEGEYDGIIKTRAAEKVLSGYRPALATIEHLNSDQALAILIYEQTANVALINPQSSMLFELDCAERMLRHRSASFNLTGKSGTSNKVSEWSPIPPEGNGANLITLLCH